LKVSKIQSTKYITIYFKYVFQLFVFQILHNTGQEMVRLHIQRFGALQRFAASFSWSPRSESEAQKQLFDREWSPL